MLSLAAACLVDGTDRDRPDQTSCASTAQCSRGELCVRKACHLVMVPPPKIGVDDFDDEIEGCGSLDASCCENTWPDVRSCVLWAVDEDAGYRYAESNAIPPYDVVPYCPYGLGQGYCQSPVDGDSTDCAPFKNLTCPCAQGSSESCATSTTVGDVPTAAYQRFAFPLHPDPTAAGQPAHMYDNSALTNGNSYQVVGVHLNGVQIKGPAEANGYNVDMSHIPLPCGGHVTPPVGNGPLYHYHKAADCVAIAAPGAHAPLIGYASDGFGLFGFNDLAGGAPVLDECHGHFGPVDGGSGSGLQTVAYHYHASAVTNVDGVAHQPYYLGCQGPSLGKCSDTVSPDYDGGANWCGPGCDFEVCVQPGTDPAALEAYLGTFPNGSDWLSGFSVNDFAGIGP